LYDDLLKNCYTKTNAPQIIDFDKQTMIAVFGGRSCTTTNVEVKTVSAINNKLVFHSIVTIGGCDLTSFSFPFTLIVIEKSNLPLEFTFELAAPNVNPEPIKSSQPITSSPIPQSTRYQNPCPSGQFELFEGGLSSGCESPAR